jgi:DNA modification methylase
MFVWTTFHNAGAVNYVLQRQGRNILNNIMWLKRNPRPVLSTRRLQFSHDCIVWVGKTNKYHFNYEELYAASYDGDSIKKQGRQHRDIIEASVASREATGHPSAKPISVYTRLLDIAGKSDGVLLDPFAGSGTAAVVASRWGMQSILIEREFSYLNIIKTRMARELKEDLAKRIHPRTAVTP